MFYCTANSIPVSLRELAEELSEAGIIPAFR